MSTDLSGQTALVTGSTSGIGRATAEHLATRGAHVLVSGRDAERGEAVVAAIRAAGGKADFAAADLRDATAARDLARRATATEFGPAGVRVNAVSPGPIRTEGTEPFGPALDDLVGAAPAGRVGTPAEVAAAIGFLVGPDAGYIQGTVLAVDGGRTAV